MAKDSVTISGESDVVDGGEPEDEEMAMVGSVYAIGPDWEGARPRDESLGATWEKESHSVV